VPIWRRFGWSWDRLGRENAFGAILTRDGRVADWSVDEFLATGRADVDRFLADLDQIAPGVPRTRALDFGCGVGRVTRALSQHFELAVGVDVAQSMIARAKELGPNDPRCTFILNRATNLRRFGSGTFAVVYSRLVLQHIKPPLIRRYIPELVRVLEPGGVLMLQLPEPPQSVDPLKAFVEAPLTGGALKRRLPRSIVKVWRWLKYPLVKPPRPLMRMFGLPRDEVAELVRRSGGTILDIREDRSHGDTVPGFEYWITRSS
jgi:SAM-dependent methyltransferase